MSKSELEEFSFVPDNLPTEVIKAAETVTPPAESQEEPKEKEVIETPPTPPTPPEAPKPTEAQDTDLKGYSNSALLALSYQKVDKIIPEDVVIKPDLTGVELKALLADVARAERDTDKEKYLADREEEAQTKLREKGATEEHFAYLTQIANGADPKIVSKVMQFRSWSQADLETEEQATAAIRASLLIQGQKADLIDSHLETRYKTTDELLAAAKEHQVYIGQVADAMETREQQRLIDEKKQDEENEKSYFTTVEKQIKLGFGGLKLDKSKEKEFTDYMTKKTETVTVETPQGKIREKVTKYEADRMKHEQDVEKTIMAAYFQFGGMTGMVNAAHTAANDKFLGSIRAAEEQTTRQAQNLNQGNGAIKAPWAEFEV